MFFKDRRGKDYRAELKQSNGSSWWIVECWFSGSRYTSPGWRYVLAFDEAGRS